MHARDKCWPQNLWSAKKRPSQETNSSDFAELIKSGRPYIDKSMFIEYFFKHNQWIQKFCFDYPSQSGKSINLSMLKYFFGDESAKHLFDGLEISKYPKYMAHQGRYKVIYLNFNELKNTTEADVRVTYKKIIQQLYQAHYYLIDNGDQKCPTALDEYQIKNFMSIINGDGDEITFDRALKNLMEYISADRKRYTSSFRSPILLVDGGDALVLSREHREIASIIFGGLENFDFYNRVITMGNRQSQRCNPAIHRSIDNDEARKHFGCSHEELTSILQSHGIDVVSLPLAPDFYYQELHHYNAPTEIPDNGKISPSFFNQYYIEKPAYFPKTITKILEEKSLNNNASPQLK